MRSHKKNMASGKTRNFYKLKDQYHMTDYDILSYLVRCVTTKNIENEKIRAALYGDNYVLSVDGIEICVSFFTNPYFDFDSFFSKNSRIKNLKENIEKMFEKCTSDDDEDDEICAVPDDEFVDCDDLLNCTLDDTLNGTLKGILDDNDIFFQRNMIRRFMQIY